MDKIASSIAAGEKPVPLSTLDSMAISCVEKQLETQANEEQEQSEEQTLTPEEQAELQTFLDITQKNTETAKWLFNREKVPVELDIQRLAARTTPRHPRCGHRPDHPRGLLALPRREDRADRERRRLGSRAARAPRSRVRADAPPVPHEALGHVQAELLDASVS